MAEVRYQVRPRRCGDYVDLMVYRLAGRESCFKTFRLTEGCYMKERILLSSQEFLEKLFNETRDDTRVSIARGLADGRPVIIEKGPIGYLKSLG